MIERSDLSMEQLRKNITSKGGTTQAGLNALAQHDIEAIFKDCLNAQFIVALNYLKMKIIKF